MGQAEKHLERCHAEATRDVVFLLQSRTWKVVAIPEGYEHDGEGVTKGDGSEDWYLTGEQLSQMQGGECDVPCAIEEWRTESVWIDRDEAERFAKEREYNYREGWRVFGVCANGELGASLRSGQFAS